MRFQLAKFRVTGPRLCFRRPWNLCHDLRLPSATIGPTPFGRRPERASPEARA
jgi:hypothetical protein